MKRLTSLVLAVSLLCGASAAVASLGADAAMGPAVSAFPPEGVEPVTSSEMSTLTGAAPDWLLAGCVAVGGFTGGRAAVAKIAGHLGKRIVIGTLCPVCGTAMTIAALACIFF